ncbi:MAG: hypothetical protein ACRC3B_13900 [Bacteroidia bacterium]
MQEGKQNTPTESRAAAHIAGARSGVSFPAPIQLYTTPAGKKLSAGANYYVEDVDQTKLYVKAGAALGNHGGQIVAAGAAVVYNAANYTPYHYYADDTGGFVNDCLNLAEQLTGNTKIASNGAEMKAPGTGANGGKAFGSTLVQNTTIANDAAWATDESANPAIGEAYAMAPTVKPVGHDPRYHAAAVVAKDGTDNITLEADAGSALTRPVFDIYDTQPPGVRVDANSKTFHEVYSATYTFARGVPAVNHAPSTGVLRHR